MFSFKTTRIPPLDPMFLMKCHKNLCFVSTTTFLVLLCLYMSSSFHNYYYFSSSPSSSNITIASITLVGLSPKAKPKEIPVQVDRCSGRYIYMHDLPSKFNRDLVKNCKSLSKWFDFCPYFVNNGFGPLLRIRNPRDSKRILSRKSWYATNQFMLSVIFHNRMKKYECLTSNSSLASAIYAPFYAGLEVGRYLFDDYNSSIRDAMPLDFAKWLREKPEWDRMRGGDHFFVAGRITWDFRRLSNSKANWGNKLLNLPEVKNMTMLTIESSPYGKNDFAVPYPTYFHPYNDNEVFKWQERVRRHKRTHLFAFGGASRPKESGSIRGELIDQCKNASSELCKLVSCLPNDDMCNSPDNFIRMFMQSDFCLQPPGDSFTRRSTFDSILAGCIPVFFHPGSAYIQYLWHFPKNYTEYSVFIPVDGIKNGTVSVQKVLSEIPEDRVSAMREVVIGMIPKIIYARRKLDSIEDAFDVALKRVLERVEGIRGQLREGRNPSNEFPEQSSWKYYLTGEVGKHEWDSFF